MKALILVIIFLLVNMFLLAQKDISIACIPFTGDSIESEDEANLYAGYFTSEFKNYGYKLIARTTALKDLAREIAYQQTGLTEKAVEYGKQAKADYVMKGSLLNVGGLLRLQVQIISIEKAELVASDTREVKTKKEINKLLVEDMVSIFNEQITGKKRKVKYTSKLKMFINNILDESLSF